MHRFTPTFSVRTLPVSLWLLALCACGGGGQDDTPKGGDCHATISSIQASNVDPSAFEATSVAGSHVQGDTTLHAMQVPAKKETELGQTSQGDSAARSLFVFVTGEPLTGKDYVLAESNAGRDPGTVTISYVDGVKDNEHSWAAQAGTIRFTSTGASSLSFSAEATMKACTTCSGSNPAHGTFQLTFSGNVDSVEQ